MSQYAFDVKIPTNPATGAIVAIDTNALYGYWERRDGTEGGGLWFTRTETGAMELTDYDGAFGLPKATVQALRAAGYVLDETFDA